MWHFCGKQVRPCGHFISPNFILPIGSNDLHAQRSREVSAAGRSPGAGPGPPGDALGPSLPNGDSSDATARTPETPPLCVNSFTVARPPSPAFNRLINESLSAARRPPALENGDGCLPLECWTRSSPTRRPEVREGLFRGGWARRDQG